MGLVSLQLLNENHLFRLLRQGMGGEWGIGASLALETLPIESRGLFSGIYQEGKHYQRKSLDPKAC